MGNVGEYIKSHPWVVAAIIFAAGLIYLYFFRGSDTVVSGGYGPSAEALAAEVQLAGINAAQSNAAANRSAQLEALTIQGANQLEIAKLQQTVALGAQSTELALTIGVSHDTLAATLARIEAERHATDVQAANALAITSESVRQNIAISTLQAQVQEAITASQVAIAHEQGLVTIEGFRQQTAQVFYNDLALTNINQALIQGQVDIARINAEAKQSSDIFGGLFGLGSKLIGAFF